MIVNIRQGIQAAQNSIFLLRRGNHIGLNILQPLFVTFAHGPADYLLIEATSIRDAWRGPFENDRSYWFYWDIGLETGNHSYGFTQVEPSFGNVLPSSPQLDQHFFDLSDMYMKVWDGSRWVDKIRVFAGRLINNRLIQNSSSSQINVTGSFRTGIIRKEFKTELPVRKYLNFDRFEFITETGDRRLDVGSLINLRIEDIRIIGAASETIPKNVAVTFNDNRTIRRASYFDTINAAIGVTEQDTAIGEERLIVTRGYVKNPVWAWQVPPLTPLYVGADGELTTTIPDTSSIQRIGYVIADSLVFIDVGPHVILTD